MRAIIMKQLPGKPEGMHPVEQELWELCLRCWNHSPGERIAIEDIIKSIARIPGGQSIQILSSSQTSVC